MNLNLQLRELRKEIRVLKNSVSFLNDEVEKMKKENTDLMGITSPSEALMNS